MTRKPKENQSTDSQNEASPNPHGETEPVGLPVETDQRGSGAVNVGNTSNTKDGQLDPSVGEKLSDAKPSPDQPKKRHKHSDAA